MFSRGCSALVFLVLIFSQAVVAQDAVVKQALDQQLHKHETWRKLLHLPRGSGGRSAIHSKEFFLAEKGRKDPKQELIATIKAFYADPGDVLDHHAQCAFRGRYIWLNKMLNIEKNLDETVQCAEFNKWSYQGRVESLSLIYATGYLGNPASYYGHTLIKINTSDEKISSLEDASINFGANVPDNEGMLPYILKGLFGGYDGSFTHSEYFYHSHNYAETELRDLWEYQLNLSEYEIDLILGHVWELLGKKYTYLFLNRNCSHRMAEVFELLDGVEVVPDGILWSMPQSFLQNLASVKRDGESFVANIEYHPSRQASLYNRYSKLAPSDKQFFKDTLNDITLLESERFADFPIEKRHILLDTLLDYYQFRADPKELEKDINNVLYKEVLKKRYREPPGVTENAFPQKYPPHQGRKPSYIQLSGRDNALLGSGGRLKIRPAYYDNLDSSYGHISGAALSMGELEVSYYEGNAHITRLDIVTVENINKNATGLPGDRGKYWKLRLGSERESYACDACLVPDVELTSGFGRSLAAGRFYGAGYIGAGLTENTEVNDAVYAQSGVLSTLQLSSSLNIVFDASYKDYLDGKRSVDRWVSRVEGRWGIGKRADVRVQYQKNLVEEWGASFGLYW